MHYKGLKKRRIVSRSGEVDWERPYYYGEACRRGFFPQDEAFGVNASGYSVALQREMVWLSGRPSEGRRAV